MPALRERLYHLLRVSERYTHADMVFLAKGGWWMMIGQAINILLAFLVSIAFANLFPKEAFGTYKFVLSAVALIGVFSALDIGTAVTQAAARGFDGTLAQGFRANLRWSIGVTAAGAALGIYYYLRGNDLLAFSFIAAGLLSPLIGSASLYGAYLVGKKDFKRHTLYGILRNVLPAALLLGTLLITRDLFIIITVYFLSAALVSLGLYYLAIRARRGGRGAEDPELVSYAGHLGLMGTIGILADNLDKILIFHYLGAAPLAIYAFAIAPVEQLQSGKKILNALILGRLSERPFEELQKSAPRRVWLLAAYAGILVLIYVPLVPHFYRFFYPQYVESIFYSQLYALTLFGIIGSVLESHLVAHKKKRELYVSRLVFPLLKIGLYLALIPTLGLLGLVLTQIAVRVFGGGAAYYFVRNPFTTEPAP